jgi:hypothetical protein
MIKPFYRITTYSYEEHSEIYVWCHVPHSQEELNNKIIHAMERVAREDRDNYMTSLGDVFYRLKQRPEVLEQLGLHVVEPEKTVLISAWAPQFSVQGEDPQDISRALVDAITPYFERSREDEEE